VPPFVIIFGAVFATLGVLAKKSNPKYLRRATAPPAPVAKIISLRVWSIPCVAILFSISLLIFSTAAVLPVKVWSCFASLGYNLNKNKGVAGPGTSAPNSSIPPVVLWGPVLSALDSSNISVKPIFSFKLFVSLGSRVSIALFNLPSSPVITSRVKPRTAIGNLNASSGMLAAPDAISCA